MLGDLFPTSMGNPSLHAGDIPRIPLCLIGEILR